MEIDSKFLRTKSLCAWAGCEKLIKIFSGKLKIKFDSAPSLCTKKSATHRKKGSMKGNCFIKQWIWQEKSIISHLYANQYISISDIFIVRHQASENER